MREAWEVLRDAGVPDGAIRPVAVGSLDAPALVAALRGVSERADRLCTLERECLAAWLEAFRRHWPDRFAEILGPLGAEALESLRAQALDAGRYLKLRRIAIENLSRRL